MTGAEGKREIIEGLLKNEIWEAKPLYCKAACPVGCSMNRKNCDRVYDYMQWKRVKLGDAIHDNYEYRKLETWYIVNHETQGLQIAQKISDELWLEISKNSSIIFFQGTLEECKLWVEKHSKASKLVQMSKTCLREVQDWLAVPNRSTRELAYEPIMDFGKDLVKQLKQKIIASITSSTCKSEELEKLIDNCWTTFTSIYVVEENQTNDMPNS